MKQQRKERGFIIGVYKVIYYKNMAIVKYL
jgi:hypothetical protein